MPVSVIALSNRHPQRPDTVAAEGEFAHVGEVTAPRSQLTEVHKRVAGALKQGTDWYDWMLVV